MSADPETWIAFSTFALFLVTAALALFTYKLWGSTKTLVEGAEDTAKRQLRAYLSVEFDHQQKRGTIWGSPQFGYLSFKIKNTGQTPARMVETRCAYDILPWPQPDHQSLILFLLADDTSRTVIHPKQELTGIVRSTREFTPSEIEECVAGIEKRLHVYGLVNYEDVFGEPHVTTFCLTIRGSVIRELADLCSQANAIPIDVWFSHCDRNNDAH